MKNKVIIGTRGSRLAMIQAHIVASALKHAHPALEIEKLKRYERLVVVHGDHGIEPAVQAIVEYHVGRKRPFYITYPAGGLLLHKDA